MALWGAVLGNSLLSTMSLRLSDLWMNDWGSRGWLVSWIGG